MNESTRRTTPHTRKRFYVVRRWIIFEFLFEFVLVIFIVVVVLWFLFLVIKRSSP